MRTREASGEEPQDEPAGPTRRDYALIVAVIVTVGAAAVAILGRETSTILSAVSGSI